VVVRSCFALLRFRDQRKIKLVAAGQTLLNFLDLLGIALIGLIASLAVTGINSKTPEGLVSNLLELLGLSSISFQWQAAILAFLALTVFITRTLISMFFIRKTLFFLGKCAAEIAADLFGKILARPLTELNKHSFQQYLYFLTTGIETLTTRIIGTSVTLVSDTTLLIIILVALFYVSLPMTIVAIILVGIMSWALHRLTTARAKFLGKTYSDLDIVSRESVVDALTAFKEISPKAGFAHYESEFRRSRSKVSRALAESTFMPYMGKYVIETSLMIVAFLVAGALFLFTDALNAITALSIFMAAGARLAPAVLRIQQGFVRLNNSWGIAGSTLALIDEVKSISSVVEEMKKFADSHLGFTPKIELNNVAFKYPLSNTQTLSSINILINSGESVALVGPSGSGKTSLCDLMMGLLIPDAGDISISGVRAKEAIAKWPGAIGYVPQDIYISNATVAQNIALGFPANEISEENIWQALKKAQIAEFISSLEDGLFTKLGDRGIKLSGGQRQRIGIARALLTKPKILFLDEATSALDSQTENEVAEAINALKGEVTLISIAHRLSTAKRADRVIYLEAGTVLAQGSFEEVKSSVPNFQKQAELMDLG
jgi:ABC-type multidrug transport system fused ATPase/permease subunit